MTSIVCKIMESIIRDAVIEHMKANKLLTEKQFGFLSGRSTVLQLLIIIDKWTEVMDRGGCLDVVYCDFQKAFDTVLHKRLIDVLHYYGINGSVLAWTKEFLSNRRQKVTVNGSASSWKDVPQGSVLVESHKGLYWAHCYLLFILI